MEYYERIKDIREDNEETQTDLAKKLKTSQTQIWRWESGERKITAENLKAICEHYGVSADYILGLPKGLSWPRETD